VHARVEARSADTDRRVLEMPVEGAARSLALVHREDGSILRIGLFEDEPTAGQADEVYAVATEELRAERQARYARVGTHHGFPLRDVSPAPLVGLDGLAGWMMLIDRRSGKGLGILLFDSEDALRRGDEFVGAADPGTAGPTSSVGLYDVAFLSR
jgi:hypothetical protein